MLETADQGFELAYGDIGSITYIYKANFDEAERWFEKAGCLDAPQAHDYGMLLIEERGETEKGKKYLKIAEEWCHCANVQDPMQKGRAPLEALPCTAHSADLISIA